MKIILMIAAVVGGLVIASPSNAQRYVVNGHAATPAEAAYLSLHGFADGAWVVDGWGIGPANLQTVQANPAAALRECHYILGMPLNCDEIADPKKPSG
jgi:hypothetical protein